MHFWVAIDVEACDTRKERTMTRFVVLSILAALLGGCVVVPAGYVSYSDDGYYRRGYYHDYGPRYYSYGYGYRGYYRDHGQ
jgi:hypothetical protein